MKCEFCGAEIPANCNSCPSCGAPCKCIQQAAGQPPIGQGYSGNQARNRIVFILLGLFLGCIGAHNFYAGYYGKGAAQLLITVFIGWLVLPWFAVEVWALIEAVTVTVDADNVKMI